MLELEKSGMHAANSSNISSLVMVLNKTFDTTRPRRESPRMEYDIEAQNRLRKLCKNLSPARNSIDKKSSKESLLSTKSPSKASIKNMK